ncbi:hypothetical protein E3Q17_00234 [Wallemia mellicola]|uniref:EF-hand domain-containing protein n=1 Tax=Wallemia mellicola TaxID=1708541 RepID=A0A4V4N4R1_9BASI|nr:hypothetical protein E3Q17_00234 [Wallemia mellicola]TIC69903.1 hypothetical protein E3Q02_00810 [Wallemia mellicola]
MDNKKHSSPYTKTPNKMNNDNNSFKSFYNLLTSPFKQSQQSQQSQQPQQPQQSDQPMEIEELNRDNTEDLIDWRQPDVRSLSYPRFLLTLLQSLSQSTQQTNELLASFFKDKGNRSLSSEEAVECFKLIGSSIKQPEHSDNIPSVALFSPGTSTIPSSKPPRTSLNTFLSPRPQKSARLSSSNSLSARKRPIYMGAGFGNNLNNSRRKSTMESIGRSIGVGPPTPNKDQDTSLALDTGKRRRTDESNAHSKEQQQKQQDNHQKDQQKSQNTPTKTTHLSVSRFSKPTTVVRPSPLRQVQTAESPSPEKEKAIHQNTPSKPSSRAADAVLGVLGNTSTPAKRSTETINPYQNNNPVALISKSRTPRPSKLRKSVASSDKATEEKPEKKEEKTMTALDLIEQTDPAKNKRKAQEDEKMEERSPQKSKTFEVSQPSAFTSAFGQSQPKTNPFDMGMSESKTSAFEQPAKSTFEGPKQTEAPKPAFNLFSTAFQQQEETPKATETIEIDSGSDEEKADEEIHEDVVEEPAEEPEDKEEEITGEKSPEESPKPAFGIPSSEEKEPPKATPFTNVFSQPQSLPAKEKERSASPTVVDEKDAKDRVKSKKESDLPKFTFNSLMNLPMTNISPDLSKKVDNVSSISFEFQLDKPTESPSIAITPASSNPLWAAAKKATDEKNCSVCMCNSPKEASKCQICDTPF